jgi:Zn-finger nucleic acid-binding protein
MSLGCPRCKNALVGRRVENVVVHECPDCEGVFLDENAIGLVVDDPGHTRAQALLDSLPRRKHEVLPGNRKMYVMCPTCGTSMNRKLFASGSGVVVDVCRSHGTFFDAGELPAIIDFVMAGGLAKAAARKTTERVPLRAQPDNLAKHLAIARASSPISATTSYADAGAALVGLLFELLA